MLTKKDIWLVLDGADETRRSMAGDDGHDGTQRTGLMREEGEGEQEGLLGEGGSASDRISSGLGDDVPIL